VVEAPALKSLYADKEFMSDLAERNIVVPYFEEFFKFRKWMYYPPMGAIQYHEGIGKIVTRAAITKEVTIDEGLVEMQKWIDPLIAKLEK